MSGFLYDMEATDIEAVTPLFFSDTLHGVLGTKRGIVYQTDDGGRSWQGSKAFVPVPHTRFADGSAISPGGYYRLGGADTLWRKLSVGTDQAIGAASFDGTTIASLYPQESVTRLAISTDRGTTWRTLDTTRSGSGGFLELSPLTRFGPIPAPAGKIIHDYSWREIYTFPDSRTLVVRAVTRYDSADNFYEHDYIGRLDPTTMTARWLEPPDRLESIRFISSSEAYGFTMNPEKFPSTRIHIGLWWSTDGGARWDSVGELPVSIDTKELRSLTFLSRNHGVSINAVTHDGGRSWNRWSSPFAGFQEYAPRLAVVDSAHYFIFGIYSHFARSTDAGHTWSRTLGGSFPHAAAAYRGSVVVGRDFQTLLFSADSGESWQDLAPLGRVPRELQTVWSLAWPDSVHEPERVIGIASFMPYDARQRVSFIESSDGGRSWREGARIPQFDSAIALAERAKEFGLQDITGFYYAGQPPVILRFVEKSDHSGTVGFACSVSALLQSDDAGRTWRLLCDTIRFGNIAMADAMHGVAYGLPSVSKPAALYRTDDGGLSWSWTKTLSTPYHYGVGLTAFDSNNYRLLTPDQNSDAEAWNIVWSEDGGRTWRDREYVGQNASWTMDAFWLDSTDLHIIDGFGDVRHSTNAGNTWHMLHPAIAKFGRYRVGAIISEANLTASDGSYYYFASARNLLGRWRIARRVSLPTSADDPFASASGGAGDPIVAPNPVPGAEATVSFELARGSTVAISICDLLGEQRVTLANRLLAAGAHAIPIDLSGLEPGAYFVRMVRSGVVSSFPFVIAR
jgi:photosystem II stability/assembly factor-like uncharacterized protein